MALFKCKMCGGDLEISSNESVATCEYCGTQQTLPKLDDDRRANLYDRANHFRRNNEFDKAAGIYEQILNESSDDSEAYWSLVLCRYGIEYVEDPETHKRVPTVNRAQFTSIFDDVNYKSALEYADVLQRHIYEEEAKSINEIQKGILEISQKEEPFDVFICYKETDNSGRRTPDSVLAQDLYYQLGQEGFKVFFSRITLEDKIGSAYEPYIFAALNSAKVMVVIGTKPEFFNAAWVKNEWSRYLALIKNGAQKMLIPAYKDMDPYDLPEEFSHLQAQDMGKLGFMQDLIRGIKKIVGGGEPKPAPARTPTVAAGGGSGSVAPLLKRAFMFLEDEERESADEYCEKVLDIEPENSMAYLGKLMADLCVRKQEELRDCEEPFDDDSNYQKAMRFGDDALKTALTGYIEHINTRNETARLEGIYNEAKLLMAHASDQGDCLKAAMSFDTISDYKDSAELAVKCREKAEEARKDHIYSQAEDAIRTYDYEAATRLLGSIPGWRDADAKLADCRVKNEKRKAEDEADRLKRAQQEEFARKQAEKRAKTLKKVAIITTPIACAIIAFVILLNTVIIPNGKYNDALALMDEGKYEDAISAFEALDSYKDSAEKIEECKTAILEREYNKALDLSSEGKYTDAIAAFQALNGYKDSKDQILECRYRDAVALMDAGNIPASAMAFGAAGDYKDAKELSNELWEKIALRATISTRTFHNVYLKSNGTVKAIGENGNGECAVSNWTDIVAISAGLARTVGLKSDGTVVAVGYNNAGQCNVSGWTDIVAISAGIGHTVGLKSNGTVVAVGGNYYNQCNVYGWTDIIAIAADDHTVGLKSDGTVVAVGKNDKGQCDVSGWTDIIAISAWGDHTVGLKSDGTVVAVGSNYENKCQVSHWRDIIAISAGEYNTVGLRSDGTVISTGSGKRCAVSDWKDIVAVSAGYMFTVGLKSDGTIMSAGTDYSGKYNLSDWRDIKLPNK